MEKTIRFLLRSVCRKLARVPFELVYWDGAAETFGSGEPRFRITVKDLRTAQRLLLSPDPAFGEAYMEGALEVDDLPAFLEAYHASPSEGVVWTLGRKLGGLRPRRSSGPRAQATQVRAHYDLGNEFFSLWLDPTRSYSCAYFRDPDDDLEKAQRAKIDLVLRKAQLAPGQRLLDIGCGWGALVAKAAAQHGVHAHGITLSRPQFDHAVERFRKEGPSVSAGVEVADYRALARRGERFDRVVSVGMLEHVGKRNLGRFLRSVKSLLEPGGVCVLHSIMRAKETPISAWIDKRIFPGGYIPSWREVIAQLPRHGFHLIDDESLRRHYALTLRHWLERFDARLDEIRALGWTEPMIRMWRLYLLGAAAAFKTGALDLHQLVFTNGINNELAWTREPIYRPASAAGTWSMRSTATSAGA